MRRLVLDRSFFIPKDSRKVERDGLAAVVYVVDSTATMQTTAAGFTGKKAKPDFHFRFRDSEQRDRHIEDFFQRVQSAANFKRERAEARRAFSHSLTVGSVLYSTWGYEQTNVDFYQVVELVGAHMVVIRQIEKVSTEHASMQGTCLPRADAFVGEQMRRHVQVGNSVKIASFSSASPHDGRPVGWSSYA